MLHETLQIMLQLTLQRKLASLQAGLVAYLVETGGGANLTLLISLSVYREGERADGNISCP
jgi:hypothetical protein